MPFITVETNLSYSDLPTDFGPALSKSSSEILDKPEEVTTNSTTTNCPGVRYRLCFTAHIHKFDN